MGIGYHRVIFSSGRLYWVGDPNTQRAHVKGKNHLYEGIVIIGDYTSSTPTEAAQDAVREALELSGLPLVGGHREVQPGKGICPGFWEYESLGLGAPEPLGYIPGIIKGAHAGTGLGHRFLRHIERTTLLLLLIDCTLEAGQAVSAYDTLLEEMGLFSALLPEKPRAVALTKLDLNPGQAHLRTLRDALERRSERVFAVSAVSGAGLAELLRYLAGQVFAGREAKPATAPAPRSGASTPHS
ncbi:MAG: hypothetical protein IIA40_12670 [SAR324 cluster bacterium]|nr:hypothetical protein [SAR324 cluster bacterium]